MIQAQVGGDLVALETQEKRPTNYRAEVDQNEREQNQGILPALKTNILDFNQYDRIFIGAPTWNMALPQVVLTFLTTYDFTGKTIVPFNTHGGYGAGQIVAQIQSAVGESCQSYRSLVEKRAVVNCSQLKVQLKQLLQKK